MRARTSGHANLIRDEGNTDPSHDGKRLAYTNQKGQPKWHGWVGMRWTCNPGRVQAIRGDASEYVYRRGWAVDCMRCLHDDVFFFPCIFRVAIGNSESQIEKRQVEKCKVLPLQEQQEETPQGKMQRFKSAKNTRHVK